MIENPKATGDTTMTESAAGTTGASAPAASAPARKKAAKKAAKKTARAKTESSGVRTIGGKAVDLSKYNKVKSASGGTSYHNGDAVAEKLEGKSLEDVYTIAAKALKVEVKELSKKYGHLNPGMQRMALGNRMRKGTKAAA